jgi:putative transposase
MTRYRRARTGATFFFTVVSYRRRRILCDEPVRRALREAVQSLRQARPFSIDGWVLLPDHMHCVWTLPQGDSDFSTRWLYIKRFVSRFSGVSSATHPLGTSAQKHRETAIWQRRFWEHRIRDERDFEKHLDYIHFNPVKHGFAKCAADWPYSTFHRYVGQGIYAADWGGNADVEALDFE